MRFILKVLIRLYVNKYANREIVKLGSEEELKLYQFKSSSSVLKVLKSNITIQTLKHFEAKTDQERWMIKGASLALQVMKDRHIQAVIIDEDKKLDNKKKVKMWNQLKKY